MAVGRISEQRELAALQRDLRNAALAIEKKLDVNVSSDGGQALPSPTSSASALEEILAFIDKRVLTATAGLPKGLIPMRQPAAQRLPLTSEFLGGRSERSMSFMERNIRDGVADQPESSNEIELAQARLAAQHMRTITQGNETSRR